MEWNKNGYTACAFNVISTNSTSQEIETNIAQAHVYFKQPTAKYTLAALQTPP